MLDIAINNNNSFKVATNNGEVLVNDTTIMSDIVKQPNGIISVLLNNKSYTAVLESVDRKKKEVVLKVNGQLYTASIKEPIDQLLTNMGLDLKSMQKAEPVKAPMPGMILKVLVVEGQSVKKGDGLLILEAMKMENVLKATSDCVVKSVKVAEKTAVEKGAILIELE